MPSRLAYRIIRSRIDATSKVDLSEKSVGLPDPECYRSFGVSTTGMNELVAVPHGEDLGLCHVGVPHV